MKVFLAVDYGRKRWVSAGATSYVLFLLFRQPCNYRSVNDLRILRKSLPKRKVTHLIVGLPLTLEGNKSELTIEVERFIKDILEPLGLPIVTVDEGLSSFEAESQIPKQKIKKGLQKRDGTVDSKAAALLLEDYLAQNP